ncbi:MAG TPA: NAD-dependent epimerase/dehydratase family protein [Burkholderiales bacterium]|nr:NAD-dependent epimerase/dehydratase family protein [Burkholderiales bacterium]
MMQRGALNMDVVRVKILLTGSSSYFAQALLPLLCEQSTVDSVTGVDTHDARFTHAKFRPVALDIRSDGLSALLRAHDALIHLASVVIPARMSAAEMFNVNVRAAHGLFRDARAAGMARLIHMSSAAVYGEAIHAGEQTALKPLPGFIYAEHEAHLDQLLAIELPECVRLRPQLVVGPRAHPAVKRLLKQPFYPRLPVPHPLFQCVHEDDLARAVLLCLTREARGAYNIAIEDSLTVRDAIRARRRLNGALPLTVAEFALKAASRFYGWNADPGILQALCHTLLVNCRRATIELGWRSSYSARAALATL